MALTSRRAVAGAALGLGLLIVLAARVLTPAAPPLYDGVIVNEPYAWLVPPPGARGGALGASDTATLEAGKSPLIALATPEQPPQAQIFAPPGALVLPPGTASLLLSIAPIPAEGTPANGHIAGNVYRISVTNQNGVPATAPRDAFVSLVMRGPENVLEAAIARFNGGAWQALETSHAGYTSGFLSVVTGFGDFALIAPGATGSGAAGSATAPPVAPTATPGGGLATAGRTDPLVLVLLGGGVVVVGVAGVLLYRARTRRPPPPRRGRRRQR